LIDWLNIVLRYVSSTTAMLMARTNLQRNNIMHT